MFPTKNIFESNDMKRHFSQSNDAAHYSLFQSPTANRSSSSADSVSPENFFDIPFQYHDVTVGRSRVTPSPNPTISSFNDFFESPLERTLMFTSSPQPIQSSQIYESPRYNAHRPIVGRKILGATHAKTEETDDFQDWTPPSSQPKSYELFPKNTDQIIPTLSPTLSIPRPLSIRSKSSSTYSNYSNMQSNFSNIQSNYSNTHSNHSNTHSNHSNTQSNNGNIHSNYNNIHSNHSNTHLISTMYNNFRVPQSKPQSGGQICTFCRKNGEQPAFYESHCVKKKIGEKYIVTCPVLRSHKCQECGVYGDDAHTITYCPVLRCSNNGRPLVSTTVKLKNTPIKSNGKRRYAGQIVRM